MHRCLKCCSNLSHHNSSANIHVQSDLWFKSGKQMEPVQQSSRECFILTIPDTRTSITQTLLNVSGGISHGCLKLIFQPNLNVILAFAGDKWWTPKTYCFSKQSRYDLYSNNAASDPLIFRQQFGGPKSLTKKWRLISVSPMPCFDSICIFFMHTT